MLKTALSNPIKNTLKYLDLLSINITLTLHSCNNFFNTPPEQTYVSFWSILIQKLIASFIKITLIYFVNKK